MSDESKFLAGVLLLALVTFETGGLYLVLLVLALVCQLLADETDQSGLGDWLSRSGVAVAALLMPAGFFFSSAGRDRTGPNRLIVLVYAGAVVLAAGLASLGVGLLVAA